MTSTEPSLDLSALLKQATEDTSTLPLHMTLWQKEYKEKLGLSSETPSPATNDITSTSDTVLPLHPYPLGLEVDHYQDQLNEVKKRYIQLATQHQFLDAILQDPPRQVQPDQVKELDTAVLQQYGELTFLLRDVARLKRAIAEGNTNNEQTRQELNQTRETIIQMIDGIEELKTSLVSVTSLIDRYATLRTPEEARHILQEQTELLAEINDGIDTARDAVEEMECHISDRDQDIKVLERTYREADAKAKEAIMNTGGLNVKVAEQAAWYTEITQLWHTMFGIQDVVYDAIDLLQVIYTTGDILSIHLDPLTDQITGLEVNNEEMILTDLEPIAIGKQVKDVGSIVVLETLARTSEL